MTPRFSIIIPAYNASKHIHKALDSIASQTFTDYELIVICDSCTDNTEEIAKSYGAITCAVDFHNDGLSRSKGIDMATGKWVLFMDDDDWWLHEFVLSMLHEKLRHLEFIDVLCFSFIFKGRYYASPLGRNGKRWVAVWNKVWKRSKIGKTRFPNIHSCSDRYFNNEMMAKNLIIRYWDMPFYYYNYMRKGSISEIDSKPKSKSVSHNTLREKGIVYSWPNT